MNEIGAQLRDILTVRPGTLRVRARSIKAWRAVRDRMIVPAAKTLIIRSAYCYRAVLRNVVFTGVTGSCGKTTAKDLIAAVLSSQFKGRKTPANYNLPFDIAKTMLTARPWDDFCVLEMTAWTRSGERIIGRSVRLAKPHIGVVTNIGTDHIGSFGSMENIAAEKGKLIAALPPHGTAILNADDANVLAMRSNCAASVITFGLARDAMVRAENVRCIWPEPLSFTVHYRGESHQVQTQLCGIHWVPIVLAALSVGIVMGVPLATAVQAVQGVAPRKRRMQPVIRPDGVTLIYDDMKAPSWSFPPTLQFLKDAQARRKFIVIGNISDYKSRPERVYESVARQALEVADYVIFVGPRSSKCLKAKRYQQNNALLCFYSVEDARDYLRSLVQPGDLILIKGSDRDGLQGLFPERPLTQKQQDSVCNSEASTKKVAQDSISPARQTNQAVVNLGVFDKRSPQAVVGLGNPGEQHQNTPHNAGQRSLDLMAQSLGAEWIQEDEAVVARIDVRGRTVYLIKPMTQINATGPVLLRLGQRFGFGPADCVLIHDDIDVPLGTVRIRERGSDGGHRGVRSVLVAFHTDAIRRVKIGVGRPNAKDGSARHVLTRFSATDSPVIESACAYAADRALEMVADLADKNSHYVSLKN